jgi:hypothetical protein
MCNLVILEAVGPGTVRMRQSSERAGINLHFEFEPRRTAPCKVRQMILPKHYLELQVENKRRQPAWVGLAKPY